MVISDFLEAMEIPADAVKILDSGEMVLPLKYVDPDKLRSKGVRLGRGIRNIHFFLYHSGRLLGYVVSETASDVSP